MLPRLPPSDEISPPSSYDERVCSDLLTQVQLEVDDGVVGHRTANRQLLYFSQCQGAKWLHRGCAQPYMSALWRVEPSLQ